MDTEIEKIRKTKIENLARSVKDPKNNAKKFSEAILESEEYKNFLSSDEELQKNQTAQNLLKKFQQKQMEIQWKGFNPIALEELRDLQMEMNKNESIQNYSKSQQALVDLLIETNRVISEKIGIQFAFTQGGSCCG